MLEKSRNPSLMEYGTSVGAIPPESKTSSATPVLFVSAQTPLFLVANSCPPLRLFGKQSLALAEMTANALKPEGVFGIVRVFRQSGEVLPDFKVTLIDSSQMLLRGFHLFLHHSFEVSRPHGGSVCGNPGL
jgi:hypothetical protein